MANEFRESTEACMREMQARGYEYKSSSYNQFDESLVLFFSHKKWDHYCRVKVTKHGWKYLDKPI